MNPLKKEKSKALVTGDAILRILERQEERIAELEQHIRRGQVESDGNDNQNFFQSGVGNRIVIHQHFYGENSPTQS